MIRFFIVISFLLTSLGFSQNSQLNKTEETKKAKKLAKRFMRKQKVPGMSISISYQKQLIWSEGFGYASRNPKVKVDPSRTLFRIASISKSITALILAKLVDDMLINLNESIYTYIPDYPKKKHDFTVRELAGHLAGIRSYRGNEFTLNKNLSISGGVALFANDSLLFEPSTQFSYNTFGYVLLSDIMQKAARKNFEDLAFETIISPLQMTHTTVDAPDKNLPFQSKFYKTKWELSTPVNNEYKIAGGGYLSTSEDLIKLGQEVINPSIISKASLLELITSQKLKNGHSTGYGIGFSVEYTKSKKLKYYHTGGGVGASTALIIYPEDALVICILTNKSNVKIASFIEGLEAIFFN
ncbi:serine hydrolase domain-containing protein [Cognatitamlana onchidii]|uniref:serine hydrolase domain-containing protein n=1 Tax=Cognatitamlana onchidii TaxID=2562860 RepID=UPI0010A68B43|nr:serine hydrolase domain-containing protein [Algibacter onchidii]